MGAGRNRLLGRRDVLRGVGTAGSAAVLAYTATARAGGTTATQPAATAARAARHRADDPHAPEAAVREFFGPIAPGAQLAQGRWRVVSVQGRTLGAVVVVLETAAGARFQVDVLRRDAGAQGVGNTAALSVFLRNNGDGALATDEEHGLGAMALADALAAREAAGAPVPALLTHAERTARYPSGVFAARG